MRAAQLLWIALASGLLLTACQLLIPGVTQVNRAVTTPVLPSTPSPEFTATVTSTASIAILTTPAIFPTSLFTPIPSFTPAYSQVTETPLILPDTTVLETDTPITEITSTHESAGFEKLPSNTIYKPVHIKNMSGKSVDINLHCTTKKGFQATFEYSSVKNLFIDLPEGNYQYVFFVGGRQLSGSFSFMDVPKLFITIYKDRVAIH